MAPSLHWQVCHPVNFRQRLALMALLPNLAGIVLCFGLELRNRPDVCAA
jgi:hypothetical protein